MITTLPLGHTHRDMVNRVIRQEDIVVWANKKYGQGMVLARVVSSTTEKVKIIRQDWEQARPVLVYPSNLMVVTAQISRNVLGNVGANMDLESTR